MYCRCIVGVMQTLSDPLWYGTIPTMNNEKKKCKVVNDFVLSLTGWLGAMRYEEVKLHSKNRHFQRNHFPWCSVQWCTKEYRQLPHPTQPIP